jgi:hypothetical protein
MQNEINSVVFYLPGELRSPSILAANQRFRASMQNVIMNIHSKDMDKDWIRSGA